jgi:hypothetical protein
VARTTVCPADRLKEILDRRSHRWIVIQNNDDGRRLASAAREKTLAYGHSLVGSMAMVRCSRFGIHRLPCGNATTLRWIKRTLWHRSPSADQDFERCMAQRPAHHINSNNMSVTMLRPSTVTRAGQSFREIDAALIALSISAMSALRMLSCVIGPTSL